MAKHTDRYDNDNLINLAKQKYETSQRSTLPTEIVYLPSKGKIYPKSSPLSEGKLEMRYMTAYDEDILTNTSYLEDGITLDKLLEALIITNVNVNDIALVDKDALIISARIVSYGAKYPVSIIDPNTGTKLTRSVDLKKLKYKDFDVDSDDAGEITYKLPSGTIIKYSYISTADNKDIDTTKNISSFLMKVIKQVDDSRKLGDIEDFIKYKFLIQDSKSFQNYVFKNSPGVNFEYEFEGEDGGTFTAGFPLGSDLFWP
tara:strand:+ start:3022 stop:3795 length:774 start_codon:yes stop_codon:yes gene_type:complete